jgi:hypothetical protein
MYLTSCGEEFMKEGPVDLCPRMNKFVFAKGIRRVMPPMGVNDCTHPYRTSVDFSLLSSDIKIINNPRNTLRVKTKTNIIKSTMTYITI